MQNRISLELSSQIASDTCEQISFEVYWLNPLYRMRMRYPLVSYDTEINIKDEIKQFSQSIELSPTQQEIISNLNEEQLKQLSKNIAGTIETEENFNIKNYQGMKMSGLSAAYFEGIRFFLASVRADSQYEVYRPDKNDIRGTIDQPLSYAELYNEPAFRKKAVITGLFVALQQFANKEQNKILIQEVIDKKNSDVRKLTINRSLTSIFTPYSYTTSLQKYEQSLLNSFATFKIPNLTTVIDEKSNAKISLPNDIHQIICAMLTKQDLKNLACVSKLSVEILKKFTENLKQEQKELHQSIKNNGY